MFPIFPSRHSASSPRVTEFLLGITHHLRYCSRLDREYHQLVRNALCAPKTKRFSFKLSSLVASTFPTILRPRLLDYQARCLGVPYFCSSQVETIDISTCKTAWELLVQVSGEHKNATGCNFARFSKTEASPASPRVVPLVQFDLKVHHDSRPFSFPLQHPMRKHHWFPC